MREVVKKFEWDKVSDGVSRMVMVILMSRPTVRVTKNIGGRGEIGGAFGMH